MPSPFHGCLAIREWSWETLRYIYKKKFVKYSVLILCFQKLFTLWTCLKEGITQVFSYFRKSSRKSRNSNSKVVFFKALPVSSKIIPSTIYMQKMRSIQWYLCELELVKELIFFIQKSWFFCKSKHSYQKNYDVMRILI